MSKHYTIRPEDVDRPWHRIHGRTWLVSDWIGRVMERDIGKRVYLVGGILQVENDEQRDRRMGRTA